MEFLQGCTDGYEGKSAPSEPPRAVKENGLQTPDTGTPTARSVSPSSDGGRSLPPSERSAPAQDGQPDKQSRRGKGKNNDEKANERQDDPGSNSAGSEDSSTSAGGDSGGIKSDETASSASEVPLAPPKEVGRQKNGKGKKSDKSESSKDQVLQQPMPVGCTGFQMGMPPTSINSTAFSDRKIIEALAAPSELHKRLMRTAKRVPELLLSEKEGESLSANVELYGSLSLDMTDAKGRAERGEGQQDWSSYYINGRSDVDFVVEVPEKVQPKTIANRLQKKGKWQMISSTQVHKFASTQYTLHGSFDEDAPDSEKVYLDITCIESPLHYSRFKQRQEAFRSVFTDVRRHMEESYQAPGALAFDAYIHCLKAFAAKVPGNALTGFQATCIGLFTLQIGHYKFKHNQSIALSLFEGFLRFCRFFFGEKPPATPENAWSYHHHIAGIDLSGGGRWISRMSHCWRSELYFMAVECSMNTRLEERVNVLHSLHPPRVAAEAHALLTRAFSNDKPCNLFGA